MASALFRTRHPGVCECCGERILEDEQAGFIEGYDDPVCSRCYAEDAGDEDFWFFGDPY